MHSCFSVKVRSAKTAVAFGNVFALRTLTEKHECMAFSWSARKRSRLYLYLVRAWDAMSSKGAPDCGEEKEEEESGSSVHGSSMSISR